MQKDDFKKLLHEYRYQLIFLTLGIIFITAGLVYKNSLATKSSDTEVVNVSTEEIPLDDLIVDVRGSVEKPGVYHLNPGARTEDALIKAGGVSENADRVWMDKNLDRASKIIDGQKIYIPSKQSVVLSASDSPNNTSVAQSDSSSDSNLINVNSASLSDLETLSGIGPAYGQKIIDHRPYSSLEELVSKGAIKDTLLQKIKDKISLY